MREGVDFSIKSADYPGGAEWGHRSLIKLTEILELALFPPFLDPSLCWDLFWGFVKRMRRSERSLCQNIDLVMVW